MKVKSFKEHLKTRLNQEEINQIEAAAKLELEVLRTLQHEIAKAIANYMSENDLGFNDLVRRLGKSSSQVSKILKGEANLTLSTLAQLFAIMNCKLHFTFQNKKALRARHSDSRTR